MRQNAIDRFNKDGSDGFVFLLSTRTLDRSQEGLEEKESWANEYLSSFKVATYQVKETVEEEVEVLKEQVDKSLSYKAFPDIENMMKEDEEMEDAGTPQVVDEVKAGKVKMKIGSKNKKKGKKKNFAKDDTDHREYFVKYWSPSKYLNYFQFIPIISN